MPDGITAHDKARRSALKKSPLALAAIVSTLVGAMTLGGSPQANALVASPDTTHHTRLWTQVSGGRNGYADISHAYSSAGSGYYTGKMTGTLHHYYAPPNRQVVVVFRVDGTLGGYSKLTTTSASFTKTYSHRKHVSARICLHKSGVAIHLNSGVSYCSPWWG